MLWFDDIPNVFTLPEHPEDDHVFNLAIAAHADYLVTWETLLLSFRTADSEAARRLRHLAPQLRLLSPVEFLDELKHAHD